MAEDHGDAQAFLTAEERYGLSVIAEHQRNKNLILGIPEAVSLLVPPQERITLTHITNSDYALDIIRDGYAYNGAFGANSLQHNTWPLARAGHEVSEKWSEDEIKGFNMDVLTGVHEGNDDIVIISFPDGVDESLPPEKQLGDTVRADFAFRHSNRASRVTTYLDSILPLDEHSEGRVPPEYIYGIIHRDKGTFTPNPRFQGGKPPTAAE